MNEEKPKIKIIRADDHILNNPFLYWGKSDPDSNDFLKGIKKSLEILKCNDVFTDNHNGWNIVGSKKDWVKSGLVNGKSVMELFEKGGGFPEAGPNVIRTEYFIRLYTDHVTLWRNCKLHHIKGKLDKTLVEYIKAHYQYCVVLAFKVDN